MRGFALVCALIAGPAVAQDAASEETVAALRTAIEEAGCLVTVENGDAVNAASGLGDQEIFAAVAALYEAGEVALTADGSMKLTSEACPEG